VTVDANSLSIVSSSYGDFGDAGQLPTVRANAGTSSYTIAMYGT